MSPPKRLRTVAAAAVLCAFATTGADAQTAGPARPWADPSLAPDARARMVEAQMTQAEKLSLLVGFYGISQPAKGYVAPPESLGSAGYVPGIPRLGVPAMQETDAGIGVAWAHGARPDRKTVSLPSGLATAATWDPALAMRGGAMLGEEASRNGFNVVLAGGVDLAREPRNGRNFEYGGEDPLLAGTMVGAQIAGIQSRWVISTVKHYALNDQESGRMVVSADIGETAARESDLLAFQIAIERSDPGSVMCAYNRVNGVYACENPELLNGVLKGDWRWPGFVMSDWGAVHSTAPAANAGLDQESAAASFDKAVFFGTPLAEAVRSGAVPQARLDDMVHRILRTMFAKGVIDHPAIVRPVDVAGDEAVSQADAEAGAVLLKNAGDLLPLARTARRIAVIGAHADVGVLSGGGSSQVVPPQGVGARGQGPTSFPGPVIYQASSPLRAIQARAGGASVAFDDGTDVAAAVRLAAASDVVIVFADQWQAESVDVPNLSLPRGQDALIAAVARANPRTVVVLETGGPVLMPWLGQVGAVLEAWYPGSRGGEAIARLLYGEVDPSGRLPLTFPASEAQLARPNLDGAGVQGQSPDGPSFHADYDVEGARIGYKDYDARGLEPLFPFGFGLAYTRFRFGPAQVTSGSDGVTVRLEVTNLGAREGAATPQVYVDVNRPGEPPYRRLAGWSKVSLPAGATRQVEIRLEPKTLADWSAAHHRWEIARPDATLHVGASSRELGPALPVRLDPAVAR